MTLGPVLVSKTSPVLTPLADRRSSITRGSQPVIARIGSRPVKRSWSNGSISTLCGTERPVRRRAAREVADECVRMGSLASSSLLIGAVAVLIRPPGQRTLAMIMAFGAGVLLSAVAYDLVQDAFEASKRSS